jgi:hypothetical protein
MILKLSSTPPMQMEVRHIGGPLPLHEELYQPPSIREIRDSTFILQFGSCFVGNLFQKIIVDFGTLSRVSRNVDDALRLMGRNPVVLFVCKDVEAVALH